MGSWLSVVSVDSSDIVVLETDGGAPPNLSPTPECIADLIRRHSGRIVVVTGAGISAHQLPTFRSNNNSGLWESFKPTAVDRSSFYDKPAESWKLLATVRDMQSRGILFPSLAHHILHHLLQRKIVAQIITQNIDGLHSFASDVDKVVELHGSVRDYGICENCHGRIAVDMLEIVRIQKCPECPECKVPLRPPVVLFGDLIDPEKRAASRQALMNASVVMVVGTHLSVDPVRTMVSYAKENGAIVVEINVAATQGTRFVDASLQGKADDTMAAIAKILMPDIDWDLVKLEDWQRGETPE